MGISSELAKSADYTQLLGQSNKKLTAQDCRKILVHWTTGKIKFNAGKYEAMYVGKPAITINAQQSLN